jgi:hypothetical protein
LLSVMRRRRFALEESKGRDRYPRIKKARTGLDANPGSALNAYIVRLCME